ncbi:caspase family protein [Maliponia aquimaris]|uniref:Peptidase C14 caspase domain-containing protein n=1 Tax=Maliponia aquimaris TaxID=1673631 RepID=A0A238KMR7_9RHOB|nr:caspase family protein [Maliponia aquimaris]SMX43947.1 hypothetical protein MAA8898_02942 [Maliponia aquimaris]
MTLVFERPSEAPQTHAIVIGVGHFPHLDGTNAELMKELRTVDGVTSPPNNARAIATWLIAAADRLVPPLSSVELLISEKDGSVAQFPRAAHTPAARQSDDVDRATGDNASKALTDWLKRCETGPNNLALFYGSSHGMQAQEHILLLEDAGKDAFDPWRNMLSLNHLHRNLYKKTHKRSVLLADCCRNLLEGGITSLDDFSGRRIGNISQLEYAKARNEADRFVYLLRASPPGVVAKATKNGLGYLTEALLKCLDGGAGEKKPEHGWCISPGRLRGWVEAAGRYGLGIEDPDLRPIDDDSAWDNTPILKLEAMPRYPVRVREASVLDLGRATLTLAQPATAFLEQRQPCLDHVHALCAWVPPSMDDYEAAGEIVEPGVGAVALQTVAVPVISDGQDVALRRS